MRTLLLITTLVLSTTTLYGQDERSAPRRGEEEPRERVERPEPNRQAPVLPPVVEQRREEPRPPVVDGAPRPAQPIVPVPRPMMDPWMRQRPMWGTPWIDLRVQQPHRPSRLEMVPLRGPLTDKQKRQLQALREEYRRKRQRILNNP